MARAFDLLFNRKPVPELSESGTAVAGQSQNRIESVSFGEDNSISAVAAERERISAINALASPEQAEMRDKFIASGTSALEAALALHADAKTRTPQLTEEGIAKAMLKQLNSVALPAASTLAQPDKNVLEQYNEMKDPKVSAEFYKQHKTEIDSLSNQKSTKEGK